MLASYKVNAFTDEQFEKFCKYIYENAGINLTEKKRNLVYNRLRKRVIHYRLESFQKYFDFVHHNKSEFITMIDLITTNVSSFFRNKKQFEILSSEVIPLYLNKGNRRLKIWSAGCSTGEEPYSITMQMITKHPNLHFEIIASDLSTHVLDKASTGTYNIEQLKQVEDQNIIRKFIVINDDTFSIKPELKKYITFKKHNLIHDPFPINIDIIFCRNVIIYFDKETKNKLFQQYHKILNESGFLFLGHSESLFNNRLFKYVNPSIYQKVNVGQ